jgi:hypothetical protein
MQLSLAAQQRCPLTAIHWRARLRALRPGEVPAIALKGEGYPRAEQEILLTHQIWRLGRATVGCKGAVLQQRVTIFMVFQIIIFIVLY